MLEIKKTVVALSEPELIELERIIIDDDAREALSFLKKSVYNKITISQRKKCGCSPGAAECLGAD